MKHLSLIRLFFLLPFLSLSVAQAQGLGAAPRLSARGLVGDQVKLTWPGSAVGFVLEQADDLSSAPRWEKITVTTSEGDGEFVAMVPATSSARFFRLRQDIDMIRIAGTSPVDGETGVAVTRETIFYFNSPLSTNTVLTAANLHATFGGRRILSRIELSSDRMKASLFYQEPLPGSARVVVIFDANGVNDNSGRELDADNDGTPGGIGFLTFDTLSLSELAGTAVIGTVFAAEADITTGSPTNRPLQGVTITVDGREQELRTTTDAQGKFTLSPVPPGRFFVKIDGRTAQGSSYPSGAYYPYVGKAWEAVAGKTNNLAGGTGEIFLPLISSGSLQPVSPVSDTIISLPASVLQVNPELAGLSITVPANSLFADDGTRGGRVGLAPVPPDRLPGPLPVGLNLPLVVTVQTDGPLNFDRPAPICFPNTENLPAGEKRALISFNHKKGEWEVAGSMTVSADRTSICTDPGVGVTQPGWHGVAEGVGVTGAEPLDSRCDPNKFVYDRDEDRCEIASATRVGRTGYCEVIYISCKLGCSDCIDDEPSFQSCIAYCGLSLARCIQKDDICPWPPQEDEEEEEESEEQAFNLPSSIPGIRSLSATPLNAPPQAAGSSQSSGLHYFAIENLSRNVVEQRGTSIGGGPVLPRDAILAPRSNYRMWVMSATSKRIGMVEFTTPASGQRLSLPATYLWPAYADDSDADGLNDVAEMILGSNPANSDSDGDGVEDGSEVTQGLNPLDGFEVRTGIIATVKTPGPARDIWTGNRLAATALGNAGIGLISLYNGAAPTMIAHLPLGANITRVAGSGDFVVAVGGNQAFLVNVKNPAQPQLIRAMQIAGAKSVTAGGGIAYVGTSTGQIVALHLESVSLHTSLTLPGTVDLQDLALEGSYLYAISRDRLFTISIESDTLALAGSAASPIIAAPHSRLFVGGQIAYAVHSKGFNTLSVTNPATPALLASANTAQFGWKQIALNGSGLGIAAVGQNLSDDGAHNLSLYDVSNPKSNNVFVATFPTPGIARALSIHHGLAYVADDTAGVQIVNYLAYDAHGVPPTIFLHHAFSGNTVQEGAMSTVSATVTDDVQVRNVEFFLDGIRTFSDGAYPFEYRFVAPTLSASKSSFRVRARAIDTGGNSSWSDELTFNLSPDATPPTITRVTPIGGGSSLRTVTAFFTEAIDPATLNSSTFRLSMPGPDGQFGSEDDVPYVDGITSFVQETRAASLSFPLELPHGVYRATISSVVADLAGNTMRNDFSWQFRIADAVFWSKANSGAWGDPLNWSSGAVPGASDDVIIDVPEPITVTVSGGALNAKSLTLHNNLMLVGATVQKTFIAQKLPATLRFSGGQSVLDGVTLEGDLDLSNGGTIRVRNELKLVTGGQPGGTVRIGGGGVLGFAGTQTFGPATVEFVGVNSGVLGIAGVTTLTLNSNVLIHGRTGAIGQSVFEATGIQTLVHQGKISADVPNTTLTINAESFQNSGLVEAKGGIVNITSSNWSSSGQLATHAGSRLNLEGQWSNTGTINVDSGILNLDSPTAALLTLEKIGQINRTGGAVNLATTLDNRGGVFALTEATGSWVLNGGGILGGLVTQTPAARLLFTGGQNVLDGVTLEGDLDLSNGGTIRVRNELKLVTGGQPGGTVRIGGGGVLGFAGTQTFGPATVEFVGVNSGVLGIAGVTTLTLNNDVLIHGRTGAIGQPVFEATGIQTLVNQGTISADVPGGTLTVNPDVFINNGTATFSNGGKLVLPP
ncbi:MAG: Ig-like domain-containing protein [Verrucomicrobiales bacterium]